MVLSHILDIRHLTCPMALLAVKRALQQAEQKELSVCVSDKAVRQDIVRYCEKCGLSIEVEPQESCYQIIIKRESIE